MCARVHFVYRCCHYVEPFEDDFPTWVWVEFCPSFDTDSNACGALWYETGSIAVDDICDDCKEAMRTADVQLKEQQRKEKEMAQEKAKSGKSLETFDVQIRGRPREKR
jgi:hypothetical protein